jgi:Holliday junction resolvasome RuvABC endonuclease subunit
LLLALDISTSCTGWCVLSNENELLGIGFINLSKHTGLYEKASKVKTELLRLMISYPVEAVTVEENLQAFRPGLSSAKTLMTLAQFNGVVRWICHDDLSLPVKSINVNSARKSVGLKIDRKSKKKTKEQVWEWVKLNNNSDNIEIKWPFKVLKSGPSKGQTRLCNEAYDMADAYVIGKAHFNLKNE